MSSQIPKFDCQASAKDVETDIVAVFQEEVKGSKDTFRAIPPQGDYGDLVKKLDKSEMFQGMLTADHLVTFGGQSGSSSVLFFGLGPSSSVSTESFRTAGAVVWKKLAKFKVKKARVDLSYWEQKNCKVELLRAVRAFAEGLALAAYKVNRYKTDEKKETYFGPSHITFVSAGKSATDIKKELGLAGACAEAMTLTRDWSNEPSNIGTPEFYAEQSAKIAERFGLKCRVLKLAELKKEKMGLLLGVGQGSVREPRVVVLEYNPSTKSKGAKTVCLVGKGVTFDSGGISIKPSASMEDMKHDMTGAATVMGAVVLASQMKVSNRVVALMGFVENMPSGNAIQPGNILTGRSGKTVEIINTDAEGRLVLADVLDFAQGYKPDCIVDVATLTGAVLIALGNQCTAILGNNDEFIQTVRKAGEANDERIWQLPLWDEYSKDMKSNYADIKNSVNNRLGGTIRGAAFLKEFVKKDMKWAHLDIAATAWDLAHHTYHPSVGASAALVRTLATLARDF